MSNRNAKETRVNVLGIDGSVETVGSVSCTVQMRTVDGAVLRAFGATLPSNGDAGFAKGCSFTLSGGGVGNSVYVNDGSSTSADFNLTGVSSSQSEPVTIATTGNTDSYIIAPNNGTLLGAVFTSVGTLAANDTNFITFTLTNLGQAGAGTAVMLAAVDANTTKATGGTALVANGSRAETINGTPANLAVVAGDVIRVRYAATGTLAGSVAGAKTQLKFN